MSNLERYLGKETLEKIRECDDLYLKSAMLVRILFKDKTDKSGNPYIGHLLRVSNKMSTLEGKVLGLLHDTVEDIEFVTFEDLLDIGIPNTVIESLRLVTKDEVTEKLTKEEKLTLYNKEIDRIINSGNQLAIELKYSDMSDNYNPERLLLCDEEKRKWFTKKYSPNLKKLEKVIKP